MSAGAVGPTGLARLPQDLAQGRDVAMGVDLAWRPRQAHPIDDRGVVEGVRHDEILLARDDRDDPGVRGEPGLEGQDGGCPLERGEFRLELLVHRHRAGDRPDGATADAELANRLQDGLAQPGMVGEAQVVVRGQADEPSVVDRHDRALGAAHHAQRAVQVVRSERREFVVEEGQRVGHVVQSMMTFPDSPDRAAAKAASKSR